MNELTLVMDIVNKVWPWVLGFILALIVLRIFVKYYIKVPPNVALIVSGRRHRYKVKSETGKDVVKKFGYRIVRGGATFVIPFFERVDKLSLGIMQVDIKTSSFVPCQEYIGVKVDGVANIKIGSDSVSVATAAEQFLGWKQAEIAQVATQVLEGNMREIIGRMTISDLVQNRDKFAIETQSAATADMRNMGLEIVNITIQDFETENNNEALNALSRKNVEEKNRDARIATATADREANQAEAAAAALKAEQDKDRDLRIAQARAETDRAKAEADLAYEVQQENARKALETERADAEMIKLQKETELQAQRVQIERERLSVEIREKAEAERDARIAKAEADLVTAQKEAEANLIKAEKEAEGIRLKGEAEAEAMLKKAEAMKQYGQAAMMQMVIDKLPEMAKAVSEPLSKTEKIILFGEGGASSMAKDTAGTMMQTFEAVKESVGLDIPRMLRDVTTGGLIGKAAADDAE